MDKNNTKITVDVDESELKIKKIFFAEKNTDIILRRFKTPGGIDCFLAYIDGMANDDAINDYIIRPLMRNKQDNFDLLDVLEYTNVQTAYTIEDAATAILQGDTPVFISGKAKCEICETKGFERRSVSEPVTEAVIKGSHQAFNENVRTNITLIRRILKTPQLCTEFISVGGISGEKCAVLYLENITNKQLVEEVKYRLNNISADFVSGNGMIEQMIEDSPYSLFPTVLSTERPDRAANYLSMGRVVVICDNTPFALVMPVTLSLLLDSPEGSNQRWQNGTYSRIIRMVAFFCTTALSGIYIALICFHRELIPTQMLSLISKSRANIPFPSLLELLVMEILFELVREAGLRVPTPVGSAIGVVGGLILGQAAVEANFVSPVTLIIVALSGLGNVALPDYDLAFGIRVIKLVLILSGGIFGFLGLIAATVIISALLAHQYSYGISMLSVQSMRWSSETNLFYQRPLFMQEKRPVALNTKKEIQQPHISRKWGIKHNEK